MAAEGISPEAIEASRKLVRAAQLERIKSLPPLYQLEKLPWFMARSLRRKLRRIGSKSRISSSDNLAALAEPGPPGSDSLDGVKRKRGGLGSAEAQAAVADADDDLARRVAPRREGRGSRRARARDDGRVAPRAAEQAGAGPRRHGRLALQPPRLRVGNHIRW